MTGSGEGGIMDAVAQPLVDRVDAATPTPIATVRSTSTVSRKVTSSTAASPRGALGNAAKRCASLIPQATTSSTAASAAIGT